MKIMRDALFFIFPVDTTYRAGFHGILYLFFRGSFRVKNFGQIIIVHPEHIRTAVNTGSTADTFILIHIKLPRHTVLLCHLEIPKNYKNYPLKSQPSFIRKNRCNNLPGEIAFDPGKHMKLRDNVKH